MMRKLFRLIKAIFTLKFIPAGRTMNHEEVENFLNLEEDLFMWENNFDEMFEE